MKIKTVIFAARGRIVIPISLRRHFGIEDGTKAAVQATPEGILIKPITRAYIHGLRGSLKGKGVLKALMEDREREL
jgi:bifunctional DNA-binding transcriptional regulator/antitoxin component of YhaV-PrlF toxin-antitoxin module